jgi:ferredoxin
VTAPTQQLGCDSSGYGWSFEENKYFAPPAAVAESQVEVTLLFSSNVGFARAQLYSPDNSYLGELSANWDSNTYQSIAVVSAGDFNRWVAAGQSFRVWTTTNRPCYAWPPAEVSLRFQFQGIVPPLGGGDFDGDGVSNSQDRCPTVQGTCDGCPAGDAVDSDGDGTPNCQDPDDDDDGVLDSADRCPLGVGDAACLGCPSDMCSEPSATDRDLGKNYLQSDYWGYGQATFYTTQYSGVSGSPRAAGNVQLALYANPGDDGWMYGWVDSYVRVRVYDSVGFDYGTFDFWQGCGEQEAIVGSIDQARFNEILAAGGHLRLEVENRSAGCSPYVGVRVRYSGYDVPASGSDGDGDLIPIEFDRCPTAAGAANCNGCPPELCADFDHDGIPDELDADDDNDGYLDAADAFPYNAAEWVDADGDGAGDNADTDDDNDGAEDAADGCPFDALKQSPGGCGCGVPDVDSDGDGVLDCLDGCPTDARKVAPGECGCGGFEEDVDGDGDVDCALPSGTVRAWGNNGSGQTNVPSDLGAVMSIAAGAYHTVALRTDGTVRAWG